MKLTAENYRQYLETTYASWLGKNIGVRLGAPVENWTHEQITQKYGHITGYVTDYDIFAADDDTNGPLFFVRCLLDKDEITAEDVGNTFLNYIQEYSGFFWWGGVGVSSEHTAYENLKNGIKAPLSGSKETNGIAIAEQIGGQIFSDCWGYVSGYDPELAKKLAMMASSVTHDENGIQGGIFVAVAICLSYQLNDVRTVIERTLEYLDDTMEYSRVCRDIMRYHDENPDDWHDCLKYIQENYGYDRYPGVCHIIPNIAIMIMAMCYGNNDFSQTLTMLCEAGWDTDCTCGNVGSIMGALVGLEGIDEKWIRPINDVVNASSCVGCLNIQTVSSSAAMFADLAMKLQGLPAVKHRHFELPYATEGFRGEAAVTDGKLVSNTGGELYQYAYYLADDIYDARYDPAFSPTVYPGDVISYEVEGDRCCIFVQDCEGNRYCSEQFSVSHRKVISFRVPQGLNLTVNRYGICHEGAISIYDVNVRHEAVLDIDFHDYPIDALGPKYAGDYMANVRGFVPHSGEWTVSDCGLRGCSKDHAVITTGSIAGKMEEMVVDFALDGARNFQMIWGFTGYLNFIRAGINGKKIEIISRKNGREKVLFSADAIVPESGKITLKVKYCFDTIRVNLNSASFIVENWKRDSETGAVGFMIQGEGSTGIFGFKLKSSSV